MLKLEAAIEQKYGQKVAYTTETDPASTKHYFARSAGYAVETPDYPIMRKWLLSPGVPEANR